MALHVYYPEMKEAKPKAQIEASMSYNGRYYFLYTPLALSGRGVEHIGVYQSKDLVPQAQHKTGWNKYQVTRKAFDRIKAEYSVSYEILLD